MLIQLCNKVKEGFYDIAFFFSFFLFPYIANFKEHAYVPFIVATVEEEVSECKVHSLRYRISIYWEPREIGGVDKNGASHPPKDQGLAVTKP